MPGKLRYKFRPLFDKKVCNSSSGSSSSSSGSGGGRSSGRSSSCRKSNNITVLHISGVVYLTYKCYIPL